MNVRRTAVRDGAYVRSRCAAWCFIVACVALRPDLLPAQRTAAREDAPPVGASISLRDVVRRALRDNPDLRIAKAAADAARGLATSAGSVFDPVVTSTVSGGRDNTLRFAAIEGAPSLVRSSSLSNRVGYTLNAQQRLRVGVILTPQVSIAQTDVPGLQPLPQSRASVSLGMQVPLLRDVYGTQTRSIVQASLSDASAAELEVHTSSAANVLAAVSGFWAYAAARERAGISLDAEVRAARVLEETSALVKADERPASDLVQLRGALNSARATRFTSEQAVIEAWQILALSLALAPEALLSPPAIDTPFPAPADSVVSLTADSVHLAVLVGEALRRRPDVAAIDARVSSARARVQVARRALRPDFSLGVIMGFNGINQGWGPGNFFSPVLRDPSGLNGSVQLSVAMPVLNTDARGRAAQAEAILTQQALASRVIERRIEMGVAVSTQAVWRARESLREASLATRNARDVVSNERRKFQLGLSTVFDVILAENGLTNALLAEVGGRQAYAAALARVRLERGVLVTGSGRQLQVDADALLRESR